MTQLIFPSLLMSSSMMFYSFKAGYSQSFTMTNDNDEKHAAIVLDKIFQAGRAIGPLIMTNIRPQYFGQV